jgi:hypothetical protein
LRWSKGREQLVFDKLIVARTIQGSERSRNTLLPNHKEVHEHKDGQQPGQHEGMEAVKAGKG